MRKIHLSGDSQVIDIDALLTEIKQLGPTDLIEIVDEDEGQHIRIRIQ